LSAIKEASGIRRAGRASSQWWKAAPILVASLIVSFLWLLAYHGAVVTDGAAWEHSFLLSLHAASSPAEWTAALDISRVGYAPVIVPVLVLCCLWWLVRRQPWKAALVLSAFIVLTILDYAGKPFFARPRPDLFPHPAVAAASYPSGHALFAVGFYGVITYLGLLGASPVSRRLGWSIWVLCALAVGFSRLVLGVHWPTDVVAGFIAGAVVLGGVGLARRSAQLGAPSHPRSSGLAQWPTGSSATAGPVGRR